MYHFVVLHDLGKKLAELLFRDTDLPFSRNSTHKFAYRCTNIECFLRNSRFVPLFLRSASGLYTLAKCVPSGQVNEEARYLLDVAVMYCQLRIHKFILPCETGRIWNPKIYDRPLRWQ